MFVSGDTSHVAYLLREKCFSPSETSSRNRPGFAGVRDECSTLLIVASKGVRSNLSHLKIS